MTRWRDGDDVAKEMAALWLRPHLARWSESDARYVAIWEDALYQVCTLLCQPEEV